MKIYTKRGDRGETDLFGGDRVSKDHLRVEAYGEVDELNAVIGTAIAASDQLDLRGLLAEIQSTLFDLGSWLASPDARKREKSGLVGIDVGDIEKLEQAVDRLEGELTPLKSFILPGGTTGAAALHHARTVCRRAERRTVALDRVDPLEEFVLRYLNRLSDLLFVLARVENARAGVEDVEWVARRR